MFHVVIEGTPHDSCSLGCCTLVLNRVFWPGEILIDKATFSSANRLLPAWLYR